MMQSEQILRDPNMYWISVIDAGRKKRRTSAGEEPVIGLDEVARHLPSGESLTESGQVVATLMHVADVLGLCRGVGKATICASDDFQQHHQLAKNYLQESFAEVRAPEIDVEKQGSNAMSLVLGEGESIWNSKMKKSYCLEGDLDNNPLMDLLRLTLSCQLLETQVGPCLKCGKKPSTGDKDYAQMAEVETAFASKDLHPSAFKPAAQERVKSALAPLQQLPKDAAFKKLCASLENFHKAQSKKAKK
ncbi:unnamed protein product [Effrenium voratum]|nr:unnamed protein product [Effrenium voratum]